MTYPTLYKVHYYEPDTHEEKIAHGIIYAENLSDAIAQIADWYGDDEISSDEISSVEVHLLEYQLFEISETEYKSFLTRG